MFSFLSKRARNIGTEYRGCKLYFVSSACLECGSLPPVMQTDTKPGIPDDVLCLWKSGRAECGFAVSRFARKQLLRAPLKEQRT
jgi:hypothetical protein